MNEPVAIGFPRALLVMRRLDPRIHPFRKKMDRRVKPGDDDQRFSMKEIPRSV
jgi:hypothetical protein